MPNVSRDFAIFTRYVLGKFLDIEEDVYEEAVCLFYTNMTLP